MNDGYKLCTSVGRFTLLLWARSKMGWWSGVGVQNLPPFRYLYTCRNEVAESY